MKDIPDGKGCHASDYLLLLIGFSNICRYSNPWIHLSSRLSAPRRDVFLTRNAKRIGTKRMKDLPVLQNSILYERI
jgi:hypothetical protein